MKHFLVTAAILTNDGEILCMQRAKSKYDYISHKFEFPGGKVEEGESREAGLSREIFEEMDLKVDVEKSHYYMSVEHEYADFKITMHSYLIPIESREFKLKEHESYVWLSREKLMSLDWAGADIPIVHELMKGE